MKIQRPLFNLIRITLHLMYYFNSLVDSIDLVLQAPFTVRARASIKQALHQKSSNIRANVQIIMITLTTEGA